MRYHQLTNNLVNEAKDGLPVKTLKGLYHVGTLDASKKRDGYEGAGLSVSTHPDAWRQITRGHVTGDTYSATKEGNKFLDAHGLSDAHNEQIKQWALENDYLAQQETVTVCYYDDEMEDDLCSTFNSMADAEAEYDEELEHMNVSVDKGGIVPTDKLKKETRQNRIESTGVLEFVLPIFAEQQGLDGVWWQDKLDVQRYSAPRGVIVPSKIKSWKFAVNETKAFNESLDNPYPYKWDSRYVPNEADGSNSFLAKAEMDMGELMVMFTVGFPGQSWTIDFAVDGSMDKTGDGDQFRIFATVVTIIKDWAANKVDLSKVTQIDFSSDKGEAEEDSRSKLYKRFGKQMANQLGWDLEVKNRGPFAFFKIKNPNAPVEEAIASANLTSQQMLNKLSKEMQGTHTGAMDPNSDWSKFVLSHKGFKLKDIQVDQIPTAVQSDGMSQANIEKYKKADTSQFPPMVIGNDGYLLDGNHRLQAYKAQGIKTVKAYIGENKAVNEATEMKISDLTISDAGMAIAQSVGGGSRTDAPLAVTKLPSGHVYLVNGYHRLVDAMQAGKDTVSVEYVPYEKVEILWKQEREQDIKYGKQFNEEVEVSLHGDAKKGYVLSKIEVSGDERNAGQGTKAMQDIVDRMDREGAIIALTPDSAFGGNKNRLIKFYKRFGFVPNKGMNKDYRFRETMIRYPQSNESVMEADTLTLPKISVGDQVMVGKFKNRKAEVKGFTKDKHNQPVLKTTKGDQKLFKPRISKLIVDETIDPILVENLIGKTLQWAATKGYNITKSMVQGWLKSAPPGASPADAADLITKGIATVGSGAAAISQRKNPVEENFKDGKVKGKSRPGRVKKSGASCNGSVTELRAKAKKASGEKAKMYHWCANMKSGKKK